MWGNIIRGIDGKDLRFAAICLQRLRRKQIVFFIVDIAVFIGDRILFASYFREKSRFSKADTVVMKFLKTAAAYAFF